MPLKSAQKTWNSNSGKENSNFTHIVLLCIGTSISSAAIIMSEESLWLLSGIVGLIVFLLIGAALLRDPRLIVWIILFTAPLDKFRTYITSPISFNLKLIHFLLVIVLLLWLLRSLLSGKLRLRRCSQIEILLVLLFATFGISVISAINPRESLETFLQRLLLIAYIIIIVNFVRDRNDINRATKILITASIISAFYGFFQLIGFYAGFNTDIPFLENLPQAEAYNVGLKVVGLGRYPRMNAFVNDPNTLGAFFLGGIGLLGSLFLNRMRQHRRVPLLQGIGLMVLFVALLSTISRSAMLGLAAMLPAFVFYYRRQLWHPRLLFFSIFALSMMALVIFTSPLTQPFVERIFGQDLASRASNLSHMRYAEAAFQMLRSKPLTGVGVGGFHNYYVQFIDPSATYSMSHSLYLSLLSETGPLSLIAVFLILIYLWRSLGQVIRQMKGASTLRAQLIGWRIYLLGFAISSIFYSYLAYEFVWCYLGVMLATLTVAKVEIKNREEQLDE